MPSCEAMHCKRNTWLLLLLSSILVLSLVVNLQNFFYESSADLIGFSADDLYNKVNPKCSKIITLNLFNEENSQQNQAFFLETSGKNSLGGRQSCSIESAALASGLNLKVILKSFTLDLSKCRSLCDLYWNYKNVQFFTINFTKLFTDTPVEGIENQVEKVVAHRSCHYSDIARLALMYKYGGFYLDMDIIVLQSLTELKNVYAMEYGRPKLVLKFIKNWSFVS